MKRLGALLLGALLAGCPDKESEKPDAGVPDAGPVELTEQEPNDRADQAQALTQSSIVVSSLTANPARPDEDWYVLTSPQPAQVDVAVSGIGGADLALQLLDQDRNPMLTVNSGGESKGERFPNLSLDGKIFLKVSSLKKGVGGAYTLTATFGAPTDGFEREPNDRAVDATVLALGTPVQAFLSHGEDEDYFRIDLPAPPGSEAPAIPGAPALDDAGSNEPSAAPPGPPTEAPPSPSPSPAPASPAPPSAPETAPTDPAAPAATTPPAPAPEGAPTVPAEPSSAPTTEGTAPAQPSPAPPAMPPEPEGPSMALRIEVTPVKGARVELSVLSAAEAPLFEVRGKDDEGLSLRNIGVRANDRLVYVVVKSAWIGTGKEQRRGFNAEAPYTLTVSVEPAGANAEFEPNDELARATPLPRDGFREGFLSPKTDQDYFVLRTEQPVLARIQVSGVERVDFALDVVRAKEGGDGVESLLRANDGEVKEPEILNNVFCPGECFVRVEGASRKIDGKWVRDFENSEQPYRISVSIVPDTGAEEREPNQTAALATPLALGAPIRGTIQPRRDVDLYRLDLSGRMVRTPLRATLTGILKVDLGLYLHRVEADGTLTLVQTSDRARGEQPETIRFSAEPGVYALEVRDSTRRYESNFQDRYQLTVQEGE